MSDVSEAVSGTALFDRTIASAVYIPRALPLWFVFLGGWCFLFFWVWFFLLGSRIAAAHLHSLFHAVGP